VIQILCISICSILPLKDNPNNVVCPSKHSHKRPCEQCAKGFNLYHLLLDKVEAQLEAASLESMRRNTRHDCIWSTAVDLSENLSQSEVPDSQQVPPSSFESLAQEQDTCSWIEALKKGSLGVGQFALQMQKLWCKAIQEQEPGQQEPS
jgi:hypothetical protein